MRQRTLITATSRTPVKSGNQRANSGAGVRTGLFAYHPHHRPRSRSRVLVNPIRTNRIGRRSLAWVLRSIAETLTGDAEPEGAQCHARQTTA